MRKSRGSNRTRACQRRRQLADLPIATDCKGNRKEKAWCTWMAQCIKVPRTEVLVGSRMGTKDVRINLDLTN
eukprot:7564670-Pyramimonas_sp.AAC.1